MGYMGNKLYATEVASPLFATKVAPPVVFGASTLVVDKHMIKCIYATKVVSPIIHGSTVEHLITNKVDTL